MQVTSVPPSNPRVSLPSALVVKGKHFLLISSSSRKRHLSAITSASHAAAVVLGVLQNTEQPLKHLSTVANRGAQLSRELLVSTVLQAIGRVAASEGHHITSSYVSDVLRSSKGSNVIAQTLEGSSTSSAGTILSEALLPAPQRSPALLEVVASRENRSAIISGGLSGLGMLSGLWMTELDCTSLLLLGRSGRTELNYSHICDVPAEVTMARCDVAASSEVSALDKSHRIGDILHAGGVLRDASIKKQSLEAMRQVFAPKITGLNNLGEAFSLCGANITIFSSIAGVLGSAGQANYAAANSCMDAWADAHCEQVRT